MKKRPHNFPQEFLGVYRLLIVIGLINLEFSIILKNATTSMHNYPLYGTFPFVLIPCVQSMPWSGENYVMRSLMICILHQIFFG
jgi:hypothetical protein